jgi:hypothetical protein
LLRLIGLRRFQNATGILARSKLRRSFGSLGEPQDDDAWGCVLHAVKHPVRDSQESALNFLADSPTPVY